MSELTVYACLCVECTGAGSNPVTSPIDSQLMSPCGMHRPKKAFTTFSSTPNSCLRTECIRKLFTTSRRLTRSQLMSPHGMHLAWPGVHERRRGAPNSCLRTECIAATTLSADAMTASQLMSPHGMHPQLPPQPQKTKSSQLMSPHGMHPVLAERLPCRDVLPTHVSARNASTVISA